MAEAILAPTLLRSGACGCSATSIGCSCTEVGEEGGGRLLFVLSLGGMVVLVINMKGVCVV